MSNAQYCNDEVCGQYEPCLRPSLFNPTALNATQWVLAAKAMGFQEICLTAQHEGGFALWPSAFTDYSVAQAEWKDGTGDVLAEFVAAARAHDMGVCYYVNVACNHYFTRVLKLSPEEYMEREMGMLEEILTNYTPGRLWFDGTRDMPRGLNETALWARTIDTIRTLSPSTLITGYRAYGGDLAGSYTSLSLWNQGPRPNSSDCVKISGLSEQGSHFFPSEQVGICMQEGPNGNKNTKPTYWFFHPDVPTPSHANASRLFSDIINTWGHGEVPMINIPPDRTGQLPAEYVQVMEDVGTAMRDTFGKPIASRGQGHALMGCSDAGVLVLSLPDGHSGFDYIETMEDLSQSQRITNYTVEYQARHGGPWLTLVPPVPAKAGSSGASDGLGDRPAGTDARDQYVGFRRIDVPMAGVDSTQTTAIRFRCLAARTPEIYIRQLAVYKRSVPWEG